MTPEQEFKAKRPHYSDQHIREIAAHCRDSGIPFCEVCKDWHGRDEDHSD